MHFILIALLVLDKTLADPTDFVRPGYALEHGPATDSSTDSAKATILRNAQACAKKRPSVVNDGVVAPSGDKNDYLSWAPYHWPNCNWCNSGHSHLAHSGDGGNGADAEPEDPPPDQDLGPGEDTGDDDSDDTDYMQARSLHEDHLHLAARHNRILRLRRSSIVTSSTISSTSTSSAASASESIFDELPLPQAPFGTSLPTTVPSIDALPTPTSRTAQHFAGSSSAPQAAVKTQKPSKSSCTPSPTKSLAPSATWTTCPYIARDGQVNPDVRTLVCAGAANQVSDGCLSNVMAFVISGNAQYAQTAISMMKTFFLDGETRMNPNMNYGQMVRGPKPENKVGTFTGPLDMRGLVKVVNAIMILKESKSSVWTSQMDQGMTSWLTQYLSWMQTSDIAKKACSRPNNHGTYCHLSIAALSIALGKNDTASDALHDYFSGPFREQIAQSGEQPLEAVRTRPFHYRCFNLEAMITAAKIGDYLGLNFWVQKTKYGTTIKDAVDFTCAVKPGKEDASELVPHVAAMMNAYGSSKPCSDFMSKQSGYQSKPFWFYNQPGALSNAPTSKSRAGKRSTVVWGREDDKGSRVTGALDPGCQQLQGIFSDESRVEIDNDIYVTCPELLPLFFGSS